MTDTPGTLLVRDHGFGSDDWTVPFRAASGGGVATATALDLEPGDDVETLAPHLSQLEMIRIIFPEFTDGRGFTRARQLRTMGYAGRLRAAGHVIADQYAMARRAGFDEVEIPAAMAVRQPEEQWLARANWRAHDYQIRLRGRVSFRDPHHPPGK
ncbi:MAG: DUF934 domain-containing protein [Rhodobacteraceae bacterium]|nr:DUF934 domain-containing protein [Paracoccaceae bacterium]